MLTEHHADSMLLSTDLTASKDFYHRTLGLPILYDTDQFVVFGAGHDSRIAVTASTVGSAEAATKLTFRVPDIDAEAAELRARGVALIDYPDLGTIDGVVDVGFARVAWFEDPSGNSLQLTQFTTEPSRA